MKTIDLLENLEFSDRGAHAQALLANRDNRIMRFVLKPGQAIKEHAAPSSSVSIIVLQGRGVFCGGDGQAQEQGPNALIFFEMGEPHSVRALDEDLVFVAILKEAPEAPTRPIGLMADQEPSAPSEG